MCMSKLTLTSKEHSSRKVLDFMPNIHSKYHLIWLTSIWKEIDVDHLLFKSEYPNDTDIRNNKHNKFPTSRNLVQIVFSALVHHTPNSFWIGMKNFNCFYRQTMERVNLKFSGNQVSFQYKRSYKFSPELSKGRQNDILVVPNIFLLVSTKHFNNDPKKVWNLSGSFSWFCSQ